MWTKNLFLLLTVLFIVKVVNSSPKWRSSGSSRSSHSYSRPRVSHTSHTSHSWSAPKATSSWSAPKATSSWSAPKVTHTSHSYPSGGHLSGTSNTHATSVHSYPTSNSFSGSGSSVFKNTNSHGYPSSGGLSGNTNPHYPAATGAGMSGAGSSGVWINNLPNTNHHLPSYGGNPATSHVYPTSNGGLSGNTNSGSYSHNTGTNWNFGSHSNPGAHVVPPPHYSAGSTHGQNVFSPSYHQPAYSPLPANYPQYYGPPPVYVNTVHDSGSRYSNLLTGLALYNLGRSSSHHTDHNYYHNNYGSDYYPNNNNHYNNHDTFNSGTSYRTHHSTTHAQKPKNDTQCSLKIVTQNTTETLKVPCDIVTSFFSDNQTVANATLTNSTSVVNNSTSLLTNSSAIAQNPSPTTNTSSPQSFNATKLNNTSDVLVVSVTDLAALSINTSAPATNVSIIPLNNSTANITKTSDNATTIALPKSVATDNFNLTTITTNNTNANSSSIPSVPVDPLKVTGPALDIKGMTCSVEVKNKIATRTTIVPCRLLLQYSNSLNNTSSTTAKPRLDTKEWVKSPPWWSMFAFSF